MTHAQSTTHAIEWKSAFDLVKAFETGTGDYGPFTGERALELIAPAVRARRSKRLLVYVHVPFCSSKCHFCDWVAGYDTGDLTNTSDLRQAYVDALCAQIRFYGPRLMALGYSPSNVYWGGGTPTRLSDEQLATVARTLSESFDLSKVAEYTLEGSPETLTAEKLGILREAGLNRISIGVQSFDDTILRRMGRAHSADVADRAVGLIKAAGIENFNIDLITNFPDQSREIVAETVQHTAALGVPHVSLYPFRHVESLVSVKQARRGVRRVMANDERIDAYMNGKRLLEEAGFEEYVANYFTRGDRFRFDSEWYYFGLVGDYVGFGAGAISQLGRHSFKRSTDIRKIGAIDVRGYIANPTLFEMGAPARDVPVEAYRATLGQALATREGVVFGRWEDQFGFGFDQIRQHPSIQSQLAAHADGGAVFVETPESLSIREDTWILANISIDNDRG
jgi:oxygen-independent coproporphyrinogen-3 oxidase